ncbi:MAG: hypothetical protein AAF662_10230 [Pseudomonadota bacterium]
MPMSSRLNALAIAVFTVLAAGLVWAYQRFVDAEYADGWWVLAELLTTPLRYPDTLGAASAILGLCIGTASVAVTTLCALGPECHRKLLLVGIIAAVWACSPWHVGALQIYGISWYLASSSFVVLAVVFRLSLGAQKSWWAVSAMLLAVVVWLSVSDSFWLPMSPIALFAPSPDELSPWAIPYAFSEPLVLCCVWLLLHSVLPLIDRATAALDQALFPTVLIFGLLNCGNVLSVSEQIQVRANPRLALLYSLAYSTPNPMVNWLAFEHFMSIGGEVQAERYRQDLIKGVSEMKLPDTYAYSVSCLTGKSLPLDEPDRPQVEMLRRHMDYHDRCLMTLNQSARTQ